MKKIFIALLAAALTVVAVAPAMAQNTNSTAASAKEKKSNISAVQKFTRRAVTLNGTVVSLAGTSAPTSMVITVNKVSPKKLKNWTGVYPTSTQNLTIQITSTTKVARAIGVKVGLSAFRIGDSVTVIAKTNADGTVTAQVIRDNSIHLSLKTGKIVSIDTVAKSFIMTSGKNNITVLTDINTKFKVPKIASSTFSNLTTSSTVQVLGYINTNTKTIYLAKTVRLIKK